MVDAPRATRPSPWRLQFSLRLLLLAFTAFAIGFPIWYRWPYKEKEIQKFSTGPANAPTASDQVTLVTTWQRQWGGGKLKHGPEKRYFHTAVFTKPYVNGRLNGLYTFFDGDELRKTGQLVDGNREGIWKDQLFGDTAAISWRDNRLEGLSEIRDKDGSVLKVNFVANRLTEINGRPFSDHLFALLEQNAIDPFVANELEKHTNIDVREFPVRDFLELTRELHQFPIAIDHKCLPESNRLIKVSPHGIRLREVLTLALAPHNLVCDWRFGRLTITTVDDAKDWHDPTGVSEIKPSPDSALGESWNKLVRAPVTTSPLAEVLTTISRPLGIEIDVSQVVPTTANPNAFPTVSNPDGVPFRHALGVLLYEAECSCHLEGQTLVILPLYAARSSPEK